MLHKFGYIEAFTEIENDNSLIVTGTVEGKPHQQHGAGNIVTTVLT
jgi:hypothetical protein